MPENIIEVVASWFQNLFSLVGISDVHGIPFFILIVISILTFAFIIILLRTGFLAWGLGALAKELGKQEKSVKFSPLKKISDNKLYKHLWSEYEETLHELKRKDGGTEWRSTLPAEAFFSKEVMVDSRSFVWNDFFRHLPGILTGLGIIGTFFGLIGGLEGFAPSEEAAAARESLTNLLGGVKEAFKVSAVAISAAIAVTLFEKISLTWAYKNVEKVTHAIDSLFDAGAGEEYLARMVEADETNLANAQQLKDTMVNELGTILREMTELQIAAQEKNNQVLAQSIQAPLAGVAATLQDVGDAVKGGSRDNTETMKSALDELVSGFVEKMDETLNVSMQKIAGSMENSARSMTDMQTSMDTMIDKISATSDQAITGMVEKLEVAMERTANNQEQMTQQMEAFVSELQKQINQERETNIEQQKSGRELAAVEQKNNFDRLLDNQKQMTQQMESFVFGLQKQINDEREVANTQQKTGQEMLAEEQKKTLAKSAENQAQMMEQMKDFVSDMQKQISDERKVNNAQQKTGREIAEAEQKKNLEMLSGKFDEMLTQLSQVTAAMESNISKINNTTTIAISGMNRGAESMTKAAEQFSSAGKSVTGVLEKASPLASELNQAGQILGNANQQLSGVFSQYQQVKDQTELKVKELGKLMLLVQSETSEREKLVDQLNQVISQLRSNEEQSLKYLKGVTDQLENSYKLFGSEMTKQVTGVFVETNAQVASAVSHISGAVTNLEKLASTLSQAAKGRA